VFSAAKSAVPINGDDTVSFGLTYEPSGADLKAGFRYAYDLNNDGKFDLGNGTYAGSINSDSVAMPGSVYFNTPGPHTIKGRIIDKDNGFNDYTTVVDVVSPPRVQSVVVNNGAVQRSRVTALAVTFDGHVTLPGSPATAFNLTRADAAVPTLVAAVDDTGATTVVNLSFTGNTAVDFGSLADGRYTLTIFASQVSNVGGKLDGNADGAGGDNYILIGDPAVAPKLFRLFGDADGNNIIDLLDFAAFRAAFNPNYNSIFDFDSSGTVDLLDFNQFRQRYGMSV
jgi:hypothetical protein